ncbi:hypothetical protein BDV93DRAFT_514009 [Ceratobasidium sp. AG-I]|nr:hypothetical protein BDV93DRAFT_514009 [Ceratobasidium sp. AG-I]
MALATGELPPQPEDSIPSNSNDGNRVWKLLTACWARDLEVRLSASQVQDTMYTIRQEGLKVFQVEGLEAGGLEEGGSDEKDRESQSSTSSVGADLVTKAVVEYLREAIRMGDRLPNTAHIGAAQRRALIVTPQYWENHPGSGCPELPLAINDAFRIHKMLVKYGYEQKNIRILADRIEPDGLSDPSGNHVNESLDWLVQGSRPGDYRFFHFTGYGIRLKSEVGKGKRARVVPAEHGNDSEQTVTHSRIREQTIPIREIAYYSEALITSYRPPPLFWDVNAEEYSVIRDQCVLDWTVNWYILIAKPHEPNLKYHFTFAGNNTKLAGDGFRGGKWPVPVPSPIDTQMLQTPPQPGESLTPRSDNVVMYEELHSVMKNWNEIKAKVTTWTTNRQYQGVGGTRYPKPGRFVRAFTQTAEDMILSPDHAPPSIGEVFKQVEMLMREDASDRKSYMQYPQLWTSIRNDDGAEADLFSCDEDGSELVTQKAMSDWFPHDPVPLRDCRVGHVFLAPVSQYKRLWKSQPAVIVKGSTPQRFRRRYSLGSCIMVDSRKPMGLSVTQFSAKRQGTSVGARGAGLETFELIMITLATPATALSAL